jgi:ketosteroid isomerase-like protein
VKATTLLILLLASLTSPVGADDSSETSDLAESAIRDVREKFNQAIKSKNVDAVKPLFAPNYHIVTGRSAQYHGAENEYQNWKTLFADDPSFICDRKPREIRTNPDWGLAEELGTWRCNYTVDGEKINSSGVYAAKWQRAENGTWLLQSEVFTTMICNGSKSGCKRPDPF